MAGEERRDGSHRGGFAYAFPRGLDAGGVQIGYLVGVAFKPLRHVGGDVFRMKGTLVGITQDGRGAVIARDNDESVIPTVVEDVVWGVL